MSDEVIDARPLIGLETIGDARQVILVMNQESRDKLARATGRTVVSWAGGTQGVKHSDWSPLAKRNVVIWPDADKPGLGTADEIAAILVDLGATVRVLAVADEVVVGFKLPDGWNAAHAIRDGWDRERLDGFMKSTVRPWMPLAAVEKAANVTPAPRAAPKPVRDDDLGAASELAPMIPAHHVVWGSEVEIAGILARELASDRGGHVVRAEGGFGLSSKPNGPRYPSSGCASWSTCSTARALAIGGYP